ncbi:Mur ligase [Diplogelasinospora grovesii]|uniref:tetrahydrofolate synthase n=1 Tax=Diplogelasinospora grovesii TaxID=303347 RepID=A0AAN6S3V9_9PEZI|nr:Mur ligase [Diplogelasinospora grovesii]
MSSFVTAIAFRRTLLYSFHRPLVLRPVFSVTAVTVSMSSAGGAGMIVPSKRRFSSLDKDQKDPMSISSVMSSDSVVGGEQREMEGKRMRERERDYDEALRRLAQLQSNTAVVGLFTEQSQTAAAAAAAAAASTATAQPAATQVQSGLASGSAASGRASPTVAEAATQTQTTDAASSGSVPHRSPHAPPPSQDALNAKAIPEMLWWLSQAGYSPDSLISSGLKCLHVAGTKGKGSLCTFVTSILLQYPSTAGRVGTYTSPHLVSVRERIQLGGRPISRDLFTRYFFELWDRFTQAAISSGIDPQVADGPSTKPFYFRFLTILAFHIFIREGVKSAVIECGIGGEFDPTNILPPDCVTAAVITSIGIDHVSMLGDTEEKIAWHKSGIFKRGVTGFTYELVPPERVYDTAEEEREHEMEDFYRIHPVNQVFRDRATEKDLALLVEVPYRAIQVWWHVGTGQELGVEFGKGAFQPSNVALAIAAARHHLMELGHRFQGAFGLLSNGQGYYKCILNNAPREFRTGLREAGGLRGRSETFKDPVEEDVEWSLDGAHTRGSLDGVGCWFMERYLTDLVRGVGDVYRVLIFNQQDTNRNPEDLINALLKGASRAGNVDMTQFNTIGPGTVLEAKITPLFTHVILTRNDTEKGEGKDMSVQERLAAVAKKCTEHDRVDRHGERYGTEILTFGDVPSAVGYVRNLVRCTDKRTGKRYDKGKVHVLVTGSFHLVGAVIKTVDPNVEY